MRGNDRETLLAFARGEATWAEVEGITAADAARIARTGVELAQAGRLREAALVFEAMVEINPRDAGAHAALGTVYQKLGRTEDALAAYGQALSRDAAHPVALGSRGELLLRLGRREGFGDVAAAVAADPDGKTAAGRRAARLAKAITADAVGRLGIQ
jgi:tetratricopeptide (TPR) repeat protein